MTPPLEPEETDRFSKLPTEIIHDVLRRLDSPEEAARTSVLSRTWYRHIWLSYPVVEYRDSSELRISGSSFASFASSSSARISNYFVPNRIPLSALRISLLEKLIERRRQLDKLLESCSSLAAIVGSPVEISVEILDDHYCIHSPEKLLSRNCSRTRILKLRGCQVNLVNYSGSFWSDHVSNLESLSLLGTAAYFSLEDGIRFPIAGRPEILFNSLKSLEIGDSFSYSNEIQLTSAPLLQRLALRLDRFDSKLKLKLFSSSAAPNLKVVTISGHPEVKQEDIDLLTSNLPSLESLSFHKSKFQGWKCWLRVSSNSGKLTKFGLTDCSRLKEIEIDAPNLAAFVYYQRDLDRLISRLNVVSVASDFQFAAAVSTAGYHCSSTGRCFPYAFFVKLKKLLAPLFRSQQLRNRNVVLKLQGLEHFQSFQVEQYVRMRTSLDPIVVNHLQLEAWFWTDSSWCVLEYCFSICRPKLITILQSGPINSTRRRQFLEYICRQPDQNTLSKCWRHHLKDAKVMENSGCETVEICEAFEFDSSRNAKENLSSNTLMLMWGDADERCDESSCAERSIIIISDSSQSAEENQSSNTLMLMCGDADESSDESSWVVRSIIIIWVCCCSWYCFSLFFLRS